MKGNGCTVKKAWSRRYTAQTFTDANNADDIALLENIPAQAESLLLSLKQVESYIGLQVNVDKIKDMRFNQKGDISTLNFGSL